MQLVYSQFSLAAQLSPTHCHSMDCSMPGFPVHHQLPELVQIHVYRVSDAIQAPSSSLIPFSSCLQSFPASGSFPMNQFFTSGSQSIGVSASASVFPIFRVIYSRIDWFDLLTVQGTLKSVLQLHSLKASVLQCSAFFMIQLSPSYMTTGKTIALTRRTFVGKVMSMIFNMLSRFVMAFLPSHFIKIFINCHHILIGQQSMTYWNFLRKIKRKGCSFSTINLRSTSVDAYLLC